MLRGWAVKNSSIGHIRPSGGKCELAPEIYDDNTNGQCCKIKWKGRGGGKKKKRRVVHEKEEENLRKARNQKLTKVKILKHVKLANITTVSV